MSEKVLSGHTRGGTPTAGIIDEVQLRRAYARRYTYWAIQAGLLTPLTFDRHHLSPLAALLPVRTFFTMEGGDSEFANFTLPTLKENLEARCHNVSGNKQ